MKKIFIFAVIVFFVFGFLFTAQPARAAGNIYYVSTTGSDSNAGTIAEPFRTIQHAADIAAAGDTVYARGGTYHEKVTIQNSGAADAYIIFSAYPNETAIVDVAEIFMPFYFEGGFTVKGDYVQVVGFRVQNSTDGFGIICHDSDHCVVKNNHTYNTYLSGIAVWTSTNAIVDGNEVELANNNGEQEMISIENSAFVEVTNNHVHNGGPGTNGGEGIDVKDGSHDVLVKGNHVHHINRLGIYVDAWNKHTYNVTIDGNIIHHTKNYGVALASERGGELNNVFITNNIVYQNPSSGIIVGDWDAGWAHPIHDIYIVNNTAYANGTGVWGGGIDIENPDSTAIFIYNNILSQNSKFSINVEQTPLAQVTISHNLLDRIRDSETEQFGTNYIEASPVFVNAALLDFRLRLASPAINVGTTLNAPALDFENAARDANIDMGAYEYKLFVNSISRVNASPTAKANVNFTVAFSEAVTGVDTADFSLVKTGGISGGAVSSVTGSGSVYTVTVNTGSGNGTIRLNVNSSGTGIVDTADNPLSGGFRGQVYTVNKSLTYKSTAAQDGWILESTEASNVGGKLNSNLTTFNVGDEAADKQYRAFLSFNTATLPDNAVITKARVKIKRPATGYLVGNNNPFTWGLGLKADVCRNSFGTTSALQLTAAGDFNYNNAIKCKLLAGTFGSTPTLNWHSANLLNSAFAKINKVGLTQFRLRFAKDDNDDLLADYLKFYSGEAAAANRPQLIIEYYVP